jgi:ribonuclease BN (tRNA processing enzyme)
MKITLLPSAVGGGPDHQYLSSTLINDTVVVDAGSVGIWGSPQEQARIQHVLLSHTHMDHLASLPIFVENAYEGKAECVTIHGSQTVLECCQEHLFNEKVWPDFIALSQGDKPFLRLSALEAGQTVDLDGLHVTAVALDHVVPTVGFVISDKNSTVAIVSDTGPTDEIWQRVNAAPNLKAIFVEATFPDELKWLADVSKHLTPAILARQVAKLTRPTRLVIIHLKARYKEQVIAELQALRLPGLEIGQPGIPYEI